MTGAVTVPGADTRAPSVPRTPSASMTQTAPQTATQTVYVHEEAS